MFNSINHGHNIELVSVSYASILKKVTFYQKSFNMCDKVFIIKPLIIN